MDLKQYVHCVKRFWWIAVASTVIGALAGALSVLVVPASYQSQAQVFVNVANPRSVTDLQMGEQFAMARAASYAKIATTNSVLRPVVDELHVEETPEQLASSNIVATNQPNTAMITITASGPSAQRAADLARATADSLVRVSQSLETIPAAPNGEEPATVKLNVVQRATPQETPAGPSPMVNTALGALVGLVVGLLIILFKGRRGTGRRAARDTTSTEGGSHAH